MLSHVRLFGTPMNSSSPGSSVHGFSKQEYWSGLPFPPPGAPPRPGIKLSFLHIPHWQTDSSATKREGTYVYLQLIHAVRQNPT